MPLPQKKHPPKSTPMAPNGNDQVRCCCGKLLAKRDNEYVVIRCARCKRETRIRLRETFDVIPS
ncbi:MAG: hypothetical protein V6Z89_04870 [Desulfobacter sp.]